MGIDIYLRWNEQTEEEERAQYTGFSVTSGDVGYLREAYHGGPYATRVLMPEAFEDEAFEDRENPGARIPAATLRGRLEAACGAAIARGREVYNEELTPESPEVRAFIDFVELAERLEAAGREPRVFASY